MELSKPVNCGNISHKDWIEDMINLFSGGSKNGARDKPPLSVQFFHFHAAFGKFFAK